jgi:hypothetical protein
MPDSSKESVNDGQRWLSDVQLRLRLWFVMVLGPPRRDFAKLTVGIKDTIGEGLFPLRDLHTSFVNYWQRSKGRDSRRSRDPGIGVSALVQRANCVRSRTCDDVATRQFSSHARVCMKAIEVDSSVTLSSESVTLSGRPGENQGVAALMPAGA